MYDDMAKSSHSTSPIDPSMRKVSDNASVQDVTIGMKVDEPDGIEEELQAKVEAEEELKEESNEKFEVGLEEEMEAEVEEKSKLQPEPDAKVEIVSEETLDQDENVMENGIAESPKDEDQGQTDSDSWSDFESPMKEAQQDEAKQPEVEVSKEQPTVTTTDTASHEETSKEPAPAPPKPPSEPFAIDMTKLDDIFPSIETSFPSPEPIPDVIIDDSFTSISERKAWYLMSRPGSMRKHNLGDDENYVRVGWGNSQVREQAIRIVRRWMEEDSITGRVVLGRRGGAAGAKIFNWDSSAPSTEISISELLARKNHSRQASAASKGTVASPTAAAFGWGSNPIPSPTVAAPSSAPRTSTTSHENIPCVKDKGTSFGISSKTTYHRGASFSYQAYTIKTYKPTYLYNATFTFPSVTYDLGTTVSTQSSFVSINKPTGIGIASTDIPSSTTSNKRRLGRR
uniref:Uncharacterized protein n=1 Tax=Fusarium oxysporum (strain Fo5176) TaxID=660025 RepID=A0A0D2XV47_FUSOF